MLTNLDPSSRLLAEKYEECVAGFVDLPYCEIEKRLEAALNLVPNDWQTVEARLKSKTIL